MTWTDGNSNKHDLDFVLERGGTAHRLGVPVAFIESAWRSYTKHSRNKAQEIQGAILPLLQKHQYVGPFCGAILAGVFTEGALRQLRSLGFSVVYVPASTVANAFSEVGIDSRFDQTTSDVILKRKVEQWESLPAIDKGRVVKRLRELCSVEMRRFVAALEKVVGRQVKYISILSLSGSEVRASTVKGAIRCLMSYKPNVSVEPTVVRFEVAVRFSNGNRIDGSFADTGSAVSFLRTFLPVFPVTAK